MNRFLSDFVKPSAHFARSANVERDLETWALTGYHPTGRAIDIVVRLARAMIDPSGGRALSITGPYGSGKSSLALFVDALMRSSNDPLNKSAMDLLAGVAPEAADRLRRGRNCLGADDNGLIRAITTADHESISATLLRAIARGIRSSNLVIPARRLRMVDSKLGAIGHSRILLELICELAQQAPILILIDEFGKNLEAFARTGTPEADLFLLQQLAELGQGSKGIPVFLMTLQHLAFDDYAAGATEKQRREWVKVQGRFEDVPYVDTPAQTRALIGAAFVSTASTSDQEVIGRWADREVAQGISLGLGPLAPSEIAAAFPLHPVTLLVLPELCSRYGQNERSLFSFLAGPEPSAVPIFLAKTQWNSGDFDCVGLDQVYDYFIESAGTMVSSGSTASRWLEIETILRDSHGLSADERRAAKTIAVLNLVSTGGPLRASRPILEWLLGPLAAEPLSKLEQKGLLTYREFADDYRIWRGSDFDLKQAVDDARRRLAGTSVAALLERIHQLPPQVAARHSIETGTLRVFSRRYVDRYTNDFESNSGDVHDGLLCYLVDSSGEYPPLAKAASNGTPVALAMPMNIDGIEASANELAAILEVLDLDPRVRTDWVAHRELSERAEGARHSLDRHLATAFNSGVSWYRVEDGFAQIAIGQSISRVLSAMCDAAYSQTPRIPNEMLNRTVLTSQGAKARRSLLEAMLTNSTRERLGIEGYGPERSMYEAVLRHQGIHREIGRMWCFQEPFADSGVMTAWRIIEEWFKRARDHRINLGDLYDAMMAPPLGMRAGPLPVILTAALIVHSDQIAIYEHGTFRPSLTPELSERMVANPRHFDFKHVATERGSRRQLVEVAISRFRLARSERRNRIPGVLAVVSHLVRTVLLLPDYTKRTEALTASAKAVRNLVLNAREPDELLFRDLPVALGLNVDDIDRMRPDEINTFVDVLASILDELSGAYPSLLDGLVEAIASATATGATEFREELHARSVLLSGKVLEPRLKGFVAALGVEGSNNSEWAEYVAMTLTDLPPASWSKGDRTLFDFRLAEMSAALRRVEAINYERRAKDEAGFDALRVTITQPNGTEYAEVVALDHQDLAAVNAALNDAVKRVSAVLGDSARARSAFLAAIAKMMLRSPVPAEIVIPEVDNREERSIGEVRNG